MLLSAVSVLVVSQSSSEIPEELTKIILYLITPNKSSVYTKRDVILYRYIVLVKSLYCLSEFFTELTRLLVNFIPVSSTVPVCCSGIDPNVTLFAVEHKKLRIRHKLLRVKM